MSVPEGDAGNAQAVFTVSLSQALAVALTVDFTTADDTAVSGEDYLAASGSVVIAAGELSGTLTVDVLGDTVPEPDETFFVRLSLPDGTTGVALGDAEATGTIVDDD